MPVPAKLTESDLVERAIRSVFPRTSDDMIYNGKLIVRRLPSADGAPFVAYWIQPTKNPVPLIVAYESTLSALAKSIFKTLSSQGVEGIILNSDDRKKNSSGPCNVGTPITELLRAYLPCIHLS